MGRDEAEFDVDELEAVPASEFARDPYCPLCAAVVEVNARGGLTCSQCARSAATETEAELLTRRARNLARH